MTRALHPKATWLLYPAAIAVLVGALARFYHLGQAPFSVDEYYLNQSVANVMRHGVPAFDCGGYYTRGLLLQYLCAGLQYLGLSAELAPRLIAALCSLAALPAAYLVARRVRGPIVATLVVMLLAFSVWEIEMARFGRMYAPFQVVFLWYVVFFLRYTIDRDRKALRAMLLLSVIGPMVWEGGIFLLLANLLPPVLQAPPGQIARRDWRYLALCAGLLAAAYWFLKFDFRDVNSAALPTDFRPSMTQALIDPLSTLNAPVRLLPQHPWWMAGAGLLLLSTYPALRWIWSLRSRPLLALGLLLALCAALIHQFLFAAAVLLLLLLARCIDWRRLAGASARPYQWVLLASLLFWIAFGLTIIHSNDALIESPTRELAMLAYQLMRFPDFIGVVVRPWAWAVPHLGMALLLLCAFEIIFVIRDGDQMNYELALLVLLLVLLLAASASPAPRQETRYVFNLYPLMLVVAVCAIARIVESAIRQPAAMAGVTTALVMGGFALSEDFSLHHLRYIDSDTEAFRQNMAPGVQSHLVIRDNYRALAGWLHANVPADAIVINGVHGLDHYYPAFKYFFVEESSPNFTDWSCRKGTVERWNNYPLLYSESGLAGAIGAAQVAYLVDFGYDSAALLRSLAPLHPRVVASEGAIIVVELQG
jgi:hypothetical protein